ncbi:hypothetical protein [Streptomyces griseocarneus]|uniref:hypothetical protein n=1 Tax=Streptomyces griseocarneus TaxID=51201 RepID=UPI00167CCE99|nr:hypothetical protein [Streptomyces griseocarneus]MBZ6476742.1 hypothetical protein [Streptomyces griseocarneus]GHG80666.1 hypothetical protein GCM10018779_62420 [Streptomyces griseocarneus]
MITLKFALNEVMDIAMHSALAPRHTLRATSDQCENGETVHAALWWIRDGSGTYLTGNSTHKGAPRDAFAEGYGPGGDDASGILGGDSRVIDAIPLYEPETSACLHSALIRAQREGHNTLALTLDGAHLELRTLAAPKPVAPYGLTAYTRGIVDLAAAKELRLTWKTGKAKHLLHLAARGPHGVKGHVVIGARSGKVLRAAITYPSDYGVVQTTAEGTNDVRTLLDRLSPSPCPSGCTAPGVNACFDRALQK